MNKQILLAGSAAAILLIAAHGVGVTQEPQLHVPQLAPQPSPPAPYAMTMGDMMNTLVQPRHLKLGIAGHAGNWPLAAYALVEIRQTFAGIIKAQPKFRGYPVADLVDAALKQPLAAVDDAITAARPEEIRHRLRSTHPRLQCLPRLARSSFRSDQGPRCVGLSESGFQSGTIESAAHAQPLNVRSMRTPMPTPAKAAATPTATVSAIVRAILPFAIQARPTPSKIKSAVVTATDVTRATVMGRKTKGRIGTAAARKSASSIQMACTAGIDSALAAAVERGEETAERGAICATATRERGRLLLREARRGQSLQKFGAESAVARHAPI